MGEEENRGEAHLMGSSPVFKGTLILQDLPFFFFFFFNENTCFHLGMHMFASPGLGT